MKMKNFITEALRPPRNTKNSCFLSDPMCPKCLGGEFLEVPLIHKIKPPPA